jgi:hypothetical protein
MELVTIDALLTVVSPRQHESLRAWTHAAQRACEQAEQQAQPLWQALPHALEGAGWQLEGSYQQAVPLPQLAVLLRADAVLAALLDRRGGVSIPEEATGLLDAWWQRSLAMAQEGQLTLLVATLSADDYERPKAQLCVITLAQPSWRWLARSHLVQARLQRLTLRLDPHQPQPQAGAQEPRARAIRMQAVSLDAPSHPADTRGLARWLAY